MTPDGEVWAGQREAPNPCAVAHLVPGRLHRMPWPLPVEMDSLSSSRDASSGDGFSLFLQRCFQGRWCSSTGLAHLSSLSSVSGRVPCTWRILFSAALKGCFYQTDKPKICLRDKIVSTAWKSNTYWKLVSSVSLSTLQGRYPNLNILDPQ